MIEATNHEHHLFDPKYKNLIYRIESLIGLHVTSSVASEIIKELSEFATEVGHIKLLMTVREAAKYLRVSESFLNQARIKSNGPPFIRIGSRVIYRRVDIDNWCAKKVEICYK